MHSSTPSFRAMEQLVARSADALGAGPRAIATRDRDVIRQWADRHRAEPATGEATPSGPATIDVRDDGAGVRFNFPGAGRFRPITWDEWFANFARHHLTFVYEEEITDRAYAVWQTRGGGHGHDRDDWFEAERQMGSSAEQSMGRYRITSAAIGS